jgi:GAF domain-containing protein
MRVLGGAILNCFPVGRGAVNAIVISVVNAPLPPNEKDRLTALRSYEILDTPPELAFERITTLAARVFAVPFSLLSFIDENRQWMKACMGTDMRQSSRDIAFCAHAILHDEVMVIPDATQDVRFMDNPLVVGPPAVRFYAGAPLVNSEGFKLGTVCILDTQPRAFGRAALKTLEDLAVIVVDQLELRRSAQLVRQELEELKAASSRSDSEIGKGKERSI